MHTTNRVLRGLMVTLVFLTACGLANNEPTATPMPPVVVEPTTTTPAATATPPPATEPAATATGSDATPTETVITMPPPDTPTAPSPPGPVDPARYRLQEVARGFDQPLLVTHAGDGSGRLFIVEQTGAVHVMRAGQILPEPFLNLRGQLSGAFEQGLLGLAFSPDFAENGMFFINYTDPNGDTHVDRCFVSDDNPDVADTAGCTTVLIQDQPYPNHNGGHLAFGPDGYLYVGLGDGGSAGDPQRNAQNLQTLLGKLLRLEVDGDEAPYTAPPDNPFAGRDDARAEIWAYGLRNPWRFSFDRLTGDLWIGDVGQNAWEEINYQPAGSSGGENYGWDYLEGNHAFEGQPPASLTLVPPVAEYAQQEGGCSVTGGYVYRGASLPELNGVYFYGDYCSGLIWTLRPVDGAWESALFAQTPHRISSFGEDEAGELYVVDHRGAIYRLMAAE